MKTFVPSFILFVLSAAINGQSDTAFTSLKPSEFSAEMNIVRHVLVDVREPFEFRRSRIAGAVNIPSQADLEAFADTTYITSHVFLYCTTGIRSSRAAKFLNTKGFIHSYNLDGGIAGWKKAGLPVERRKKR